MYPDDCILHGLQAQRTPHAKAIKPELHPRTFLSIKHRYF
jgi:hypothetical protein